MLLCISIDAAGLVCVVKGEFSCCVLHLITDLRVVNLSPSEAGHAWQPVNMEFSKLCGAWVQQSAEECCTRRVVV